jgi:D-glycero-alpha-D-manno-heptose-7-phosphate kinase
MIVTKTPLRMSFVGGGSDMEAYYKENEGAVISTSIDKYMYITLSKKFSGDIRLSYSKTEQVNNVNEILHPLVRESLSLLNINGGIEITSTADIPSQGSGLGSSSSYTVGLLNALHALQKKTISKMDLAEMACHIEINKCEEPIGKQDQYAAAIGGLNLIQFKNDGSVVVEKVQCSDKTRNIFEESILIFYTGRTRKASDLLSKQRDNLGNKTKRLMMDNMVKMAYEMKSHLENNHIDSIGNLLHENWLLKKQITMGVSDKKIDEWYLRGINAGALGGKLMGAGHGGFLMFMADPKNHRNIIKSLSDLKHVPFSFDQSGSCIVYNDQNE